MPSDSNSKQNFIDSIKCPRSINALNINREQSLDQMFQSTKSDVYWVDCRLKRPVRPLTMGFQIQQGPYLLLESYVWCLLNKGL
jgi:hypothetical protein